MSLINTCVLIKSFISPFKSCNAWSKSDKVCIFAGLGAIGAPGAVDVPVYWTFKTYDNPCNFNIDYLYIEDNNAREAIRKRDWKF